MMRQADVEALGQLLPTYARVVRDGKEIKILAEELVLGDLIIWLRVTAFRPTAAWLGQ